MSLADIRNKLAKELGDAKQEEDKKDKPKLRQQPIAEPPAAVKEEPAESEVQEPVAAQQDGAGSAQDGGASSIDVVDQTFFADEPLEPPQATLPTPVDDEALVERVTQAVMVKLTTNLTSIVKKALAGAEAQVESIVDRKIAAAQKEQDQKVMGHFSAFGGMFEEELDKRLAAVPAGGASGASATIDAEDIKKQVLAKTAEMCSVLATDMEEELTKTTTALKAEIRSQLGAVKAVSPEELESVKEQLQQGLAGKIDAAAVQDQLGKLDSKITKAATGANNKINERTGALQQELEAARGRLDALESAEAPDMSSELSTLRTELAGEMDSKLAEAEKRITADTDAKVKHVADSSTEEVNEEVEKLKTAFAEQTGRQVGALRSDMEGQLVALKDDVSALKGSVQETASQTISDVEAISAKVASLEGTLEERTGSIPEQVKAQLQDNNKALLDRIGSQFGGKLKELRTELEQKTGQLDGKVDATASELRADMERKEKALQASVASVQSDISEQLINVRSDVDKEVEEKIAAERASMKERLAESMGSIDQDLTQRLEGLRSESEGRISEHEARLADLEGKLAGLDDATQTLNGHLAALDERLEGLVVQLYGKGKDNGDINELRQNFTTCVENFSELQRMQATLRQEMVAQNQKLAVELDEEIGKTSEGLKAHVQETNKSMLERIGTQFGAKLRELNVEIQERTGQLDGKVAATAAELRAEAQANNANVVQTISGQVNQKMQDFATNVKGRLDKSDAELSQKAEAVRSGLESTTKELEAVKERLAILEEVLEIIAGPKFEGAGAIREFREETTKRALAMVLSMDDYAAYVNDARATYGTKTVDGLLAVLAKDKKIAYAAVARVVYNCKPEELDEPRNSEMKDYVEQMTERIVTRAQECARGDA